MYQGGWVRHPSRAVGLRAESERRAASGVVAGGEWEPTSLQPEHFLYGDFLRCSVADAEVGDWQRWMHKAAPLYMGVSTVGYLAAT